MTNLNPFNAFIKTISYFITGKIHLPKEYVGKTIVMEDGEQFRVFRNAIISTKVNGNNPAVFKVRFHLTNMTPKRNMTFSLIPMLIILGLPGFRAKLWTWNEFNGDFQGIYQWDTLQDVKNYANSFALKVMTDRSVPGSVSHEIIPNQSLNDYIGSLKLD